MITDTHCHLGSDRYSPEEIPEIIARAKEAGVHRIITLATDEADQLKNLTLAQTYPEIFCCLGIHPCDVHETRDDFESLITPHLDDPKVVALGETGLDYFHPAPDGWENETYHARQRDFFRRHLQLASDFGLNVAVHTRDKTGSQSLDDALEIYAEYSDRVKAVFHCFPGPPETAQRIFAAGGIISFTGIATFKNAHAVVDTVKAVPAGTFMLETDAPYLAPTPHRGKRCEPAHTRLTAEAIANFRDISLEQLAQETETLTRQFFRLP